MVVSLGLHKRRLGLCTADASIAAEFVLFSFATGIDETRLTKSVNAMGAVAF